MIDRKTKEKFLQELERVGNVVHACRKVGIPYTSTVYRWVKNSKTFKEQMEVALEVGRKNIIDIAESSIVKKSSEGDVKASIYILSRTSERYKPRRDSYVFEYKKDLPPEPKRYDFQDMLRDMAVRDIEKEAKERETMLRDLNNALPRKPLGEPIYPWEMSEWMDQIIPWREAVRKAIEENKPLPSDRMKHINYDAVPSSPEATPAPEPPTPVPDPKPEPNAKNVLITKPDGSISFGPPS